MFSPFLEIDTDALLHNFNKVRELAPNSKVLAMVKANAYGHGSVVVAETLKDADAFGVARVDEALQLRRAGIKQPIVLMGGLFFKEDLDLVEEFDLDILVHDFFQIEMIQNRQRPYRFRVWMKINTGLNRLGFDPEHAERAYRMLNACPNVVQPMVVMSHFVAPERQDHTITQRQALTFHELTQGWDNPKSLAKSAAIIDWPDTHLDWVRPGIMLYGMSPFANKTGQDLGLEPVMTLKTLLVRVDNRHQGDNLGYGATWSCPQDMPIGVIAMGYADGYPCFLPQGAPVLVGGVQCQIIGRVCMDLMLVDLRQAPGAKAGDEVVLWGRGLPVEKVARAAQTIPYTLTTGVTSRVKRYLVKDKHTPQEYARLI